MEVGAPDSRQGRRYQLGTSRAWKAATLVLFTGFTVKMAQNRAAPEASAPPIRFSVSLPATSSPDHEQLPMISPDGQYFAYSVLATGSVSEKRERASGGTTLLWIRTLDGLVTRALPGTEGATLPFWSPDSRVLGFFAGGKLKTIPITGGVARTICDAPQGRGGAWSREGAILFAPDSTGGLYQVPATGERATPVTSLDRSLREVSHRWPQFLPDGRHFFYLASSAPNNDHRIYLGMFESSEKEQKILANSNVAFADPGYVLFARGSTLFAQRFHPKRLRPTGPFLPVATSVGWTASGLAAFSVSQTGVVAYWNVGTRRLSWFDRSGQQQGTVGPAGEYTDLKLFPDEKRLAVQITSPQTGRRERWVVDLADGSIGRRSREEVAYADQRLLPISPNGEWTAYAEMISGRDEIFVRSSRTPDQTRRISTHGGSQPLWRRDGKELFYLAPDRTLMAVAIKPDLTFEVPRPLFTTRIRPSDDGRYDYAATADGQRFLINSLTQEPTATFTILNAAATALQ